MSLKSANKADRREKVSHCPGQGARAKLGNRQPIDDNRENIRQPWSSAPLISDYFVRIGILGQVGRFRTTDGQSHHRASGVICRTCRGLESGIVLSLAAPVSRTAIAPHSAVEAVDNSNAIEALDGSIVRRQTVADQLLLSRLESSRHEAYHACVELLAEHNLSATLMDVEHLFDGRSLYFYFLGDVSPEVDALTEQLAATYDAHVQFRAFSDAVQQGCGPDCGTEESGGCGTNCASCAIASACNS